MFFIGVDLHKRTLSVCVMVLEEGQRRVVARQTLSTAAPPAIVEFLGCWTPFQLVVEASASHEWFVQLVEPMADRVLLAHPGKLRVIAESTRKTDKLDAQVLAEFLALGMIPQAHRPLPRVREHRALVRQRVLVVRRSTSLKNRLHHLLGAYNADISGLFSAEGRAYLKDVSLSESDRFAADLLLDELEYQEGQLAKVNRRLLQFAKQAPLVEQEARAVLETIPCVGPITIDVVLSTLGDVRRFRSQKQVAAYAGLAPGIRSSAGRTKQQGITRRGPGVLRAILVELAWRMVRKTHRWGLVYERLRKRMGGKKAIVAVARRLLCVIAAMLRSGQRYSLATEILTA
jgi:transposase